MVISRDKYVSSIDSLDSSRRTIDRFSKMSISLRSRGVSSIGLVRFSPHLQAKQRLLGPLDHRPVSATIAALPEPI